MPVERVLPSLEYVEEGSSGWAHTEPQVPCSLMSGAGVSGVGPAKVAHTPPLRKGAENVLYLLLRAPFQGNFRAP